jgi:hypothetical protein
MQVYVNRGFSPRLFPDFDPFRASLTRKEINFQFSEVVLKFFFEVQQRSDLSSHSYGGYEIDDRSGPQKQDPAYSQYGSTRAVNVTKFALINASRALTASAAVANGPATT